MRGFLFAAALVAIATCGRAGEPTHWSFTRPVRPQPPEVRDGSWPRNPIDRFVLARMEAEGIAPAPEAERATLIRRLSFDLIGLPPTPEELAAFVDDPAADSYEQLVDRLLASPRFGERQAQHWLDLARYADSDGFEFDQARPDMWRYRDWVVSAINRDLPYDQFLRLQIAGDEAAPGDPSAFVATGFNRLYPDMVDLNDQALRRQNALNDITETLGSVALGLTIGCARCHDHKTDPIKQEDFYALQAFFAPARFRDDVVVASGEERRRAKKARRPWEAEVAEVREAIREIEAPAREAIAPGPPPGLSDEAARAFAKVEVERDDDDRRLIFEAASRDPRVTAGAIEARLDESQREEWKELRGRLDRLAKNAPPDLPRARGIEEVPGQVPVTHLLRRGDFASKGREVSPAFPAALAGTRKPAIRPTATSSGRRTALVDWLVDPSNPLTARVMVNRLWQGHMGRGIAATSGDLGAMGDEPTHPELLDWLAVEVVAKGWSTKAIHRLIVTSATYRQGKRITEVAKADSIDAVLGRHDRRRLDGEAIRDAMLASSGLLNPAIGGPCVFPELPRELARLSGKGPAWPVSARREDRDRRSLYVFLRRNLRYPLFEVFDKPDTNASCPSRAVTTIAPQALSLLNGELANRCARALAERAAREAGPSGASIVDRLYRLALGRGPSSEEAREAAEFLEGAAMADLALAIFNSNEFIYVD